MRTTGTKSKQSQRGFAQAISKFSRTSKEFAALHRTMKAWVARQQRDGWQSAEVEHYATRVLCGLWACAHNNPVHPVLLQSLAEDTEALARARAASIDAQQ